MPSTRRIVKVFDSVVDYYDSWYEQPMGRYVLDAEVRALDLLLPRRGLGLDVGCGTGVFPKALMKASSDRRIICSDPSMGMLRRARERGVESVACTMGRAPFRRVFDFAYAVTVIEFLENPVEELAALRHVLKDRAAAVFMTINKESSWGRLYRKLAEEGEPVLSLAKLYSIKDVETLLAKAGYEVVEMLGTLDTPPNTTPEKPFKLLRGIELARCGVVFFKCQA